jgi:hypothetical protein
MQHKPIPRGAAEVGIGKPPKKSGACEIVLFPGFDIRVIAQAPELWSQPRKPKAEPACVAAALCDPASTS